MLRQAVTLADLNAPNPTLPAVPGGSGVVAAWQARRQTASAYARCLAEHGGRVTPAVVAVSLLHLHHIRVHGIDSDAEARTHRLARSIALTYTARHTPAPEGTS